MRRILVQPEFVVIALCWIAVLVLWTVLRFRTKPDAERTSGSFLPPFTVILAALILLIRRGLIPPGVNPAFWNRDQAVLAAATVLTVLGLAVLVWTRLTLAGNWSGRVTFKVDHHLVRTGPYGLVRHPIYTGFLLMMLGAVVIYGRLLGVLAFLAYLAGFLYKMRREEALMMKHFPDEYAAYRRRVRALVPFVV